MTRYSSSVPHGSARADDFVSRLHAIGATVPSVWLRRLLGGPGAPRWLLDPAGVSPVSGKRTSQQAWALLVFHGLLSACGARVASTRGRALVFDLAAAAVPMAVRGRTTRRPVSDAVQKAIWVRGLLGKGRPGDDAAACLLALESCGALAETPAMVEQARWRQGPGAEITDAQAIGLLVAEVLWQCHEDAGALLRAVAARTGATACPAP